MWIPPNRAISHTPLLLFRSSRSGIQGQANAPEEEDNHDEKSLTGSSVSDSDDDETSAPALTAVTETAKDGNCICVVLPL